MLYSFAIHIDVSLSVANSYQQIFVKKGIWGVFWTSTRRRFGSVFCDSVPVTDFSVFILKYVCEHTMVQLWMRFSGTFRYPPGSTYIDAHWRTCALKEHWAPGYLALSERRTNWFIGHRLPMDCGLLLHPIALWVRFFNQRLRVEFPKHFSTSAWATG